MDINNRENEKLCPCLEKYLTYTGKTLIVKNLLISLCGYEIEMRGIPEKYVKEITTLAWGFIWGGGINQIDRKVCYLGVENGGMGMINIQ